MAIRALFKPHQASFQLPQARRGNLSLIERRRRQATIDLLHSSPHLRRDLGLSDDRTICRGQ